MSIALNIKELTRSYIDQENWYVLYTRPNFEKIIDKRLKEHGFNSYLPLQKELRQWNDRKVWIETPLFKSYIFLKTSIRKKDLVFKITGILNYVRFGSQLPIISEQEIDRIKQLCLYQGKILIELENSRVGEEVEIREGPLAGLHGILTGVNDTKKVCIHIESLNCFASVVIGSDSVSLKYN